MVVSRVKLKADGRIVGYAFDEAEPETPLIGQFWLGETQYFEVPFDQPKPDSAPPGAPPHCGFNIRPSKRPAPWLTKPLHIRVRGAKRPLNRNSALVMEQVHVLAVGRSDQSLMALVRVPRQYHSFFACWGRVNGVPVICRVTAKQDDEIFVTAKVKDTAAVLDFSIYIEGSETLLMGSGSELTWTDYDVLSAGIVSPVTGGEHHLPIERSTATGVDGRLEAVRERHLIGWAGKPQSSEHVQLNIFVQDYHVGTAVADVPRNDLARSSLGSGAHGFRWPIPAELADRPIGSFIVVPHLSSTPLRMAHRGPQLPPEVASVATNSTHSPASPSRLLPVSLPRALEISILRRPKITIVVPIFNAAAETRRCIDALVAHTSVPARLLLIDDGSTDPAIKELLTAVEPLPNVSVVRHTVNQGFTRSVSAGIALAEGTDVVLLNSDATVGPRWLQGLSLAAHSSARTGTATAISDNAGPFSVPISARPEWLGEGNMASAARLFAQTPAPVWPDTPTGNGFCLYIRRDCFDEVGTFDADAFPRGYGEENDFCMRAHRLGWTHVVDDRTLVYHQRSASFGSEKDHLIAAGRAVIDARYPDYRQHVRNFISSAGLHSMRERAERALEGSTAGAVRPRIMYVINKDTGGTPQTNRDLMSGVVHQYEPFVLRFDRKRLYLERVDEQGIVLLESYDLTELVSPLSHRSNEYDRVLSDWLIKYAIELVHIRHIGWHSLGLARIAQTLSIPMVFSFHDFYTVCPSLKLMDHQSKFCAGSCTQVEGNCQPELWDDGDFPPLRNAWVHTWRDQMRVMLASCDAFVTTSPFARNLIRSTYPETAKKPFVVVPHGRSFEIFASSAAQVNPGERLRIVVPGNIGIPKGAALIRDIKRIDADNRLEFHIVGAAHPLLKEADVICHGRFERSEIIDRIAGIAPHVGGIFSIWPETYCHTLTELWAAGVPAIAFDVGALGERIREHGGGWLLKESSPADVYNALIEIADDAPSRQAKIEQVQAWQVGPGSAYGVPEMSARYLSLYSHVLRNRRSFAVRELLETEGDGIAE